ncbi:MAG: Holliday junction resolvase Hjc, partial [Candidatus Diapherotrites archaeon]
MARYGKGASAERELMRLFSSAGFAVVRSAGSGKSQLPCPDVVVLNNGKVLSFECKAWRSKHLVISEQQMSDLFKWQSLSGSSTFVAWKFPNKGW